MVPGSSPGGWAKLFIMEAKYKIGDKVYLANGINRCIYRMGTLSDLDEDYMLSPVEVTGVELKFTKDCKPSYYNYQLRSIKAGVPKWLESVEENNILTYSEAVVYLAECKADFIEEINEFYLRQE